jgi:stage VI sporulation protein D
MRLGQLSRKLELPSSKIIAFIEKEFEVTINEHPNTKIDDSFLEKIEAKFKVETPEPAEEIIEQEIQNPIETEVDNAPVIEEKEPIEIEKEEEDNETIPVISEEKEEEEEIELIKAPKQELKQLKVLRTIDLPQKKKTITIEDDEEEEKSSSPKTTSKDIDKLEKELKASIDEPAPIKKKESTYVRPNKPMKKKKSVDEVLAEKKKQQEKERLIEEKKQKEIEKYEKKRKKEHYATKVAKAQPKKKKKKKASELEANTSTNNKKTEQKEKPKTWIGKLIHWFQTS